VAYLAYFHDFGGRQSLKSFYLSCMKIIGVKSLLLKIYYLFDIKKPVQDWIYSTVSQGRERLRERLKKDKELQGLMGRIEEKMSKVKI